MDAVICPLKSTQSLRLLLVLHADQPWWSSPPQLEQQSLGGGLAGLTGLNCCKCLINSKLLQKQSCEYKFNAYSARASFDFYIICYNCHCFLFRLDYLFVAAFRNHSSHSFSKLRLPKFTLTAARQCLHSVVLGGPLCVQLWRNMINSSPCQPPEMPFPAAHCS